MWTGRSPSTSGIWASAVRRLAVPVEDHDLSAGDFEGVHEGQARGSGAVIIWDEGRAEITRDEPGHLSFTLHGSKLAGRFGLTRTGERRWILVKVRDEHARAGSDIVAERPASVRSGKTWQELINRATPAGPRHPPREKPQPPAQPLPTTRTSPPPPPPRPPPPAHPPTP